MCPGPCQSLATVAVSIDGYSQTLLWQHLVDNAQHAALAAFLIHRNMGAQLSAPRQDCMCYVLDTLTLSVTRCCCHSLSPAVPRFLMLPVGLSAVCVSACALLQCHITKPLTIENPQSLPSRIFMLLYEYLFVGRGGGDAGIVTSDLRADSSRSFALDSRRDADSSRSLDSLSAICASLSRNKSRCHTAG